TGKAFMRKGDYSNATIVLMRAQEQAPGDMEIIKDLAMAYYYAKDYKRGLDVLKPVLDKDGDDQCFQIAGTMCKATGDFKEAEKIYNKGIKRLPTSGALYSEYRELLWAIGNLTAIKTWQKGIEHDPNYPGNYYNAAK